MTENKQFVSIDDGLDFSIKHIESGEVFYDCESVVDILNELAEENKKQKDFINQLQEELVFFKTANVNVILKLEEENKELKYKYDEQSNEKMGLEEDIDRLLKENKELKAENEQLKQLIKKTLETTPIEHTLAMELKNTVRELYD